MVSRAKSEQIHRLRRAIKHSWYPDKILKQKKLLSILEMEVILSQAPTHPTHAMNIFKEVEPMKVKEPMASTKGCDGVLPRAEGSQTKNIMKSIMDDIIDNIVKVDEDRREIIKRYNNNVRGKELDTSSKNKKHCGKEGHCLEEAMGIKPNGKNEPDIFGYEMKNDTKVGVTTFIDKEPDYFNIRGENFTGISKKRRIVEQHV